MNTNRFVLTPKEIPSTRLVTITADDPRWKTGVIYHANETGKEEEGGRAFVRLYPPIDATDKQIEFFKESLLSRYATAVRVMPKPSQVNIVSNKKVEFKQRSHREVITNLVSTSHSEHKTELEALCGEIMNEESV
jgi:hypothetical protein